MALIKAVFFDAAGTLFEPREPVGETYARIARLYGVDSTGEAIDAAFRRTFRDAPPLAFGSGHEPAQLRRLEREWWQGLVARTFAGFGRFNDFASYFNSLFEFFADPAHWVADSQAIPSLRTLREQGLALGVISNFDYRLYRILDGLELSPWFDSITISSEAGYAKPSARLFEMALARHQIPPDEALHVGDSEHLDVLGASAAGMATVLINHKVRGPVRVQGRWEVSSLGETVDAIRLFEGSQAGRRGGI